MSKVENANTINAKSNCEINTIKEVLTITISILKVGLNRQNRFFFSF